MEEKGKLDFCVECRKYTEYEFQKASRKEMLRGREYGFTLTEAVCKECGERMHIPGIIDVNIREREEQYGRTEKENGRKAVKAAGGEGAFGISGKMLASIAYIFERMEEVTPLALQKLLYYIQGIYMALFGTELFPEDCCAWQHGPVYEKVYFLFRDFKYNPIEDKRFALFAGKTDVLSGGERMAADLVIDCFGKYSGKALEIITHNEKPWMDARKGCGADEASRKVVLKENMKEYFEEASLEYGFHSAKGLNRYIEAKLEERDGWG